MEAPILKQPNSEEQEMVIIHTEAYKTRVDAVLAQGGNGEFSHSSIIASKPFSAAKRNYT